MRGPAPTLFFGVRGSCDSGSDTAGLRPPDPAGDRAAVLGGRSSPDRGQALNQQHTQSWWCSCSPCALTACLLPPPGAGEATCSLGATLPLLPRPPLSGCAMLAVPGSSHKGSGLYLQSCPSSRCTGSSRPSPAWCISSCCCASGTCFSTRAPWCCSRPRWACCGSRSAGALSHLGPLPWGACRGVPPSAPCGLATGPSSEALGGVGSPGARDSLCSA